MALRDTLEAVLREYDSAKLTTAWKTHQI